MGSPISTGAIQQVTVQYNYAAQLLQNTFTYVVTSTTSPQDSDTLNNQLATLLTSAGNLLDLLQPIVPAPILFANLFNQWVYPIRLRRLNTVTTIVGTGPETFTGNQAFTITREGPLANRSNVSSLHIPAVADTTIAENGQWKVAFIAGATALAVYLRTPITLAAGSTVLTPCIWHRKLAGQYAPITQTFGQSSVRVMRRRTVGVGR